MRVTIIPADKTVSIDGRGFGGIDMSSVSPEIHAVQWYDAWGEIEFVNQASEGQIIKPQNKVIDDLTPYQPVLDLWERARTAADSAE